MSDKTQKSTIGSQAENPFPRVPGGSWAGITESTWREIHGNFKQKNPGFAESKHDRRTGLPGLGHYDRMWEEIERIKSQIETSVAPGRQEFRDYLQNIVDKTTGYIDSAVALAIGPFDTKLNTDKEAFKHQVAMFLVFCQMFEKKQGNKIPKVFQDPRFKAAEIYVLVGLAGFKVVQHPDAVQYMTDTSFVFSPHLTWPGFAATILKTLPALYIGNRIQETSSGVGQILAESYINQVYTTNIRELGPEQLDIIRRADRFDSFYDRHEFSRIHDRLYPHAGLLCFENTWVHVPKRAHPRPVSPGASSAATGFPNRGPNDRSDDGSDDGPPAPKVESSAFSNTATPSLTKPEDRSRQYRYIGSGQQNQNRGGGFDQRGLPNRNRTDKIKDRYNPQNKE